MKLFETFNQLHIALLFLLFGIIFATLKKVIKSIMAKDVFGYKIKQIINFLSYVVVAILLLIFVISIEISKASVFFPICFIVGEYIIKKYGRIILQKNKS